MFFQNLVSCTSKFHIEEWASERNGYGLQYMELKYDPSCVGWTSGHGWEYVRLENDATYGRQPMVFRFSEQPPSDQRPLRSSSQGISPLYTPVNHLLLKYPVFHLDYFKTMTLWRLKCNGQIIKDKRQPACCLLVLHSIPPVTFLNKPGYF